MSTGFFDGIEKLAYEGVDSTSDLAFRHYNPDEIVIGKRMEEHLRFAIAYWHSFAWEGATLSVVRRLFGPGILRTIWAAPK